MAYLWILLWVCFALAVFGYLGWSTNILIAQRRAWREFASKYKLDVTPPRRLMSPVAVSGVLNGRRVNIYAEIEQGERERTQRVYSHVEVYLNGGPGIFAVLAKKPLPEVMRVLSLPQTYSSPVPEWPMPAVAQTSDNYQFANWLTPTRMRGLNTLMSKPGRGEEPIFVIDDTTAYILWRTEDPLRDPRNLNALVQKLFGIAKDLDADTGSSATPKALSITDAPVTSA